MQIVSKHNKQKVCVEERKEGLRSLLSKESCLCSIKHFKQQSSRISRMVPFDGHHILKLINLQQENRKLPSPYPLASKTAAYL